MSVTNFRYLKGPRPLFPGLNEMLRENATICVNCGSNPGRQPEYSAAAQSLGATLAKRGIRLVYGGADVGLMGDVANAVLDGGGQVIGIIPESIVDQVGHPNLTELHVVGSMHERKQKIFELADGFIILTPAARIEK